MAAIHHTLVNRSVVMPSGCIEWAGPRDPNRYGRIAVGHKTKLAHRVAYERSIGPIPDGMHVCHHCDNPPCINPDHLFLGTNYDNIQDRLRKGRPPSGCRGENHNKCKLTEAQVLKIRNDTRPLKIIAAEYGITPQNAGDIRARRTWKCLPEATSDPILDPCESEP